MSKLIFKPFYSSTRVPNGWERIVNRETINSLGWAEGVGIAVGAYGTILRSTDDLKWQAINTIPNKGSAFLNVTHAGLYWIVVGTNGVSMNSMDGGLTWQYSAISNFTGTSSCLAYNGSLYVVGCSAVGYCYTSADLVTWTKRIVPGNLNMNAMLWTGQYFVGAGAKNTAEGLPYGVYSPDGINWTAIVFPGGAATSVISAMAISTGVDKIIVAVGGNGYLATSSNGIDWTQTTSPTATANITDVVWAGDRFVAMTTTRPIYSLDGVTWSVSPTSDSYTYVAYAGGQKLIGVFGSTYFVNSTDAGTSWTAHRNTPPRSAILNPRLSTTRVTSVASTYYLSNSSGRLFRSIDDGTSWTNIPHAPGQIMYGGVKDCMGILITCGVTGRLDTSLDGINWTACSSGVTSALRDSAGNASIKVVVGDSGKLLSSPDGAVWTSRTNPSGTAGLFRVTWNGVRFLATGNAASPITSTDGVTWTSQPVPTPTFLNGNIRHLWTGTGYVAVGTGGKAYTSTDGTTWVSRTTGVTYTLFDLANNGNLIVAINGIGTDSVIRSVDGGVTWSVVPLPTKLPTASISHNGAKFCISTSGSVVNSMLYSTDGLVWIPEALPSTSNTFLRISEDRTKLLSANSNGTYLESLDSGVTWTPYSTPFSAPRDAIIAGSKTIVAAGSLIYTSEDKVTWTSQSVLSNPYSLSYASGILMVASGFGVNNATSSVSSNVGATWTSMPGVYGAKRVRYLNGKWLITSYISTATHAMYASSDNGTTWDKRTPFNTYYYDFAYGSNTYVAIGAGGSIASSIDTVSWTTRTSGTSGDLVSMVFGGGMFLAVGAAQTSTLSYDGASWTYLNTYVSSAFVDVVWDGTAFVALSTTGAVSRLTPLAE